jgi:AcrR family transcriptional regulator
MLLNADEVRLADGSASRQVLPTQSKQSRVDERLVRQRRAATAIVLERIYMDENQLSAVPHQRQYRSEYKRVGTSRSRGELRLEILNAVRVALRAGSYETLTMEQVAARAAISRRTLYNLFTDKDELYRSSCELLVKSISEKVTDEIPEKMSATDGMRFFVEACMEVYNNDAAVDLILSVVRDGAHQRWLVQAYHRDVHDRLVRACENFILKQSRRSPLPPGVPRYIGEQLVGVVKSLTVGSHVFGHLTQPVPPTHDRLDVLAAAYAAIISGTSLSNKFI